MIRFPENIAKHPTIIHFYEWMYLYNPDIRAIDNRYPYSKIVRVKSFNTYQTNSGGGTYSPVWDWNRFKLFFFIRPYLAIAKPPIKKDPTPEPFIHRTLYWKRNPGTIPDDVYWN